MTDKVKQHEEICTKLNDIYKKKNSDYGDSFGKGFREYGYIMSIIRLEDKLNRLKRLTVDGCSPEVKSESIEDTLLDLANYAIMTIMEAQQNDT